MNSKIKFLLFLITITVISSCGRVYHVSRFSASSIDVKSDKIDSGLFRVLVPYREKMSNAMEEVVGSTANDLTKAQPEGSLGNFMADALMEAAYREYGIQPDAAFMNNGGIRLPVIKAGAITRGKIFELFPFDNLLVLVTIDGKTLQSFLDHVAGRGGWPVSGLTMKIKNKKAIDVMIGGKPLLSERSYTIAIGDYTANGGDDASMLKDLPRKNKGYLMRDAFLTYLLDRKQQGKSLFLETEKRVLNVE